MPRVIEYVGMTRMPVEESSDEVLEDLAFRGYSVAEDVLAPEGCRAWSPGWPPRLPAARRTGGPGRWDWGSQGVSDAECTSFNTA